MTTSAFMLRRRPVLKGRRALENVVHRLRDRDYAILRALYIGRSVSTRQIECAFWRQHNWYAKEPRMMRHCLRRLQTLRNWGLIRYEEVGSLKDPVTGAWEVGPVGRPLDDWGRAVTITGHGIRALVKAGLVPEIQETEPGGWVRGFETASSLRPSPTRYRHVLMTSAAVLRAIGPYSEEYTWIDARDLSGAVNDEGRVVPDALIQTPERAWAVECDRASIWTDKLIARWKAQVPAWCDAHAEGLHLPGASQLAGVLWYVADSSPHRLLSRVRKLREVAAMDLDLPKTLGWYVDSFDGLAWTWDHWLGPWTRGKKPSPQAILEQVVKYRVPPEARVEPIACLGNVTQWHEVRRWATDASLQKYPPFCLPLVRDFVEADQVWSIGHEKDQTHRMLFLISQPESHPRSAKAFSRFQEVWYRPSAAEPWQAFGPRDKLPGWHAPPDDPEGEAHEGCEQG